MERQRDLAEEIEVHLDSFRWRNSIKKLVTCHSCYCAIYPNGETDEVIISQCNGFTRIHGGIKINYFSGCILLGDEVYSNRE